MGKGLGDYRQRLEDLTRMIISVLRNRSEYPINEATYKKNPVYEDDGIEIGDMDISYLELVLIDRERSYATIGRFLYPDQSALTKNLPISPVIRHVPRPQIDASIKFDIKDKLMMFHAYLISGMCAKGEDPSTYGESANCDAEMIILWNERINLGRQVAEAKLKEKPYILKLVDNKGRLVEELRDRKVEQKVIKTAKKFAKGYGFDKDVAEHCFSWLIEQTINMEVMYLQEKAKRVNL